jgi:DNA-binding MarR family transcriptional regulator
MFLSMQNHKENLKNKGKQKAVAQSSTHPCASASPRHRLVELLWSFGPAFQRWSDSLMIEKKLSSQRLRILGSLHERGPRIMSDLKEELGVTATNITALIDALEKDELVVRKSHPTDRRATVIELSSKAKCEVALGCSAYKDRVAELFSDLSDSECKEFTRTLEKLWNRLQK